MTAEIYIPSFDPIQITNGLGHLKVCFSEVE